jgi:hypothetical protein
MAIKVQSPGFFGSWLFREQEAIDHNAEELTAVEGNLAELQRTVARQAQDILRLRAMLAGLVEVLHDQVKLDPGAVELATNAALERLSPPKKKQRRSPLSGDPYREASGEGPMPEDIAEAKKILHVAEEHHFAKRFGEAREAYQEVVEEYGDTKEAAVARQQIENLKDL